VPAVDDARPLRLADQDRVPVPAREHHRVDLVLPAGVPIRPARVDVRTQPAGYRQLAQVLAKRLLPGRSEMVVQALEDNREQRLSQAALDLRAIAGQRPRIEGQEVVGDPVETPPAARGLGDRQQPFDQPKLHQPVQGASRFGTDMVLDLVVLGPALGNGVENGARIRAVLHLGGEHQLPLGEQRRPRRPASRSRLSATSALWSHQDRYSGTPPTSP
jgi:hypothetical protein